MSFPNKEKRLKCWNGRDHYWNCLDQGKSEDECSKLRQEYEKLCPAQWVKHFDRKREYLKFKEQIEKGGTLSSDGRNISERSHIPMKLGTEPVLSFESSNDGLCK